MQLQRKPKNTKRRFCLWCVEKHAKPLLKDDSYEVVLYKNDYLGHADYEIETEYSLYCKKIDTGNYSRNCRYLPKHKDQVKKIFERMIHNDINN